MATTVSTTKRGPSQRRIRCQVVRPNMRPHFGNSKGLKGSPGIGNTRRMWLVEIDSKERKDTAEVVVAVVFDLDLPLLFAMVDGGVSGEVVP